MWDSPMAESDNEEKLHGHCKISAVARAHIIDAIDRNLPYEMAAWAARISEQTLYTWLKQGAVDVAAQKNTEYSNLLEDMHESECRKVVQHLDSIERQTKNWQARSWILERRWRKYFGVDAGLIQDLMEKQEKLQAMFEKYLAKDKGVEDLANDKSN